MRRDLLEKGGVLDAQPIPAHGRLPQLDGLRAIAIILVFIQHGTDQLPIGWIGVHLFFVLSGFLITRILWSARKDEFYWSPFYIKRATRILPPLIPFFIVCAFVVKIKWKTVGLAYIFFGANIVPSVTNVPLTELAVLWSLAVEEHFYLVWPFATRYLRRKSLIVLLVVIMIVEPVARGLATHHVTGWLSIYQLTFFQLDGLGAGALLALLVQNPALLKWLGRYAGAGAVLSGVIFAVCSRNPMFSREQNSVTFNLFGYTLLVLVFAFALAYLFANGQSWIGRALSVRPMVVLGAVSYGVYLYSGLIGDVVRWAIPITLHHRGAMGYLRLVIEFMLSVLVSWVSFRFYESPIIRWGRGKANALSVRDGRSMEAVRSVSGEG
jgi:peptidoglycan/LPS O-acetylase OafA/YrhL